MKALLCFFLISSSSIVFGFDPVADYEKFQDATTSGEETSRVIVQDAEGQKKANETRESIEEKKAENAGSSNPDRSEIDKAVAAYQVEKNIEGWHKNKKCNHKFTTGVMNKVFQVVSAQKESITKVCNSEMDSIEEEYTSEDKNNQVDGLNAQLRVHNTSITCSSADIELRGTTKMFIKLGLYLAYKDAKDVMKHEVKCLSKINADNKVVISKFRTFVIGWNKSMSLKERKKFLSANKRGILSNLKSKKAKRKCKSYFKELDQNLPSCEDAKDEEVTLIPYLNSTRLFASVLEIILPSANANETTKHVKNYTGRVSSGLVESGADFGNFAGNVILATAGYQNYFDNSSSQTDYKRIILEENIENAQEISNLIDKNNSNFDKGFGKATDYEKIAASKGFDEKIFKHYDQSTVDYCVTHSGRKMSCNVMMKSGMTSLPGISGSASNYKDSLGSKLFGLTNNELGKKSFLLRRAALAKFIKENGDEINKAYDKSRKEFLDARDIKSYPWQGLGSGSYGKRVSRATSSVLKSLGVSNRDYLARAKVEILGGNAKESNIQSDSFKRAIRVASVSKGKEQAKTEKFQHGAFEGIDFEMDEEIDSIKNKNIEKDAELANGNGDAFKDVNQVVERSDISIFKVISHRYRKSYEKLGFEGL